MYVRCVLIVRRDVPYRSLCSVVRSLYDGAVWAVLYSLVLVLCTVFVRYGISSLRVVLSGTLLYGTVLYGIESLSSIRHSVCSFHCFFVGVRFVSEGVFLSIASRHYALSFC